MLKQKGNDTSELSLARFQQFNEDIFFDHTIQPDAFTPLLDAADNHISKAELNDVLQHHFKANKSSGLSKLPLQLLKHLGPEGIQCMATFLNASAVD
jgi:hypothetical protein